MMALFAKVHQVQPDIEHQWHPVRLVLRFEWQIHSRPNSTRPKKSELIQ